MHKPTTRKKRIIIGVAIGVLGIVGAASYVALHSQTLEPDTLTATLPASSSGSGGDSEDTSTTSTDKLPSQILNLSNWKLTLPISTASGGDAEEIKQPQLASYTNASYFFSDSAQDGVVFRANAGGATTSGSQYPRSELREMNTNGDEASWSNANSEHSMTLTEAITAVPRVKPQVVAGQIHDQSDDVIEIRLEDKDLFVQANGKTVGELDANYVLGTKFAIVVTANPQGISVSYNGVPKVTYDKIGSGYYFKAGCYTQSNTAHGDASDAYGEVVIYDLQVKVQ